VTDVATLTLAKQVVRLIKGIVTALEEWITTQETSEQRRRT
jgi:hypothetical protein